VYFTKATARLPPDSSLPLPLQPLLRPTALGASSAAASTPAARPSSCCASAAAARLWPSAGPTASAPRGRRTRQSAVRPLRREAVPAAAAAPGSAERSARCSATNRCYNSAEPNVTLRLAWHVALCSICGSFQHKQCTSRRQSFVPPPPHPPPPPACLTAAAPPQHCWLADHSTFDLIKRAVLFVGSSPVSSEWFR
jgi:hypothetical protein